MPLEESCCVCVSLCAPEEPLSNKEAVSPLRLRGGRVSKLKSLGNPIYHDDEEDEDTTNRDCLYFVRTY